MIKPLLIVTKENGGILGKALKKFKEKSPRTQIGAGWSLKRFIDADLKNYMGCTHIILDISAFTEQEADFIALLTELQQKHEKAVIIIYCCDSFSAGDLFLHQLVEAGFTNIIADYPDIPDVKNQELIQEDISECLTVGLSAQKYERFILPSEIDDETTDGENEVPSDYSGDYKSLIVFGSQRRIGTTTFAMGLCQYVIENDEKAALVLVGENAEMEYELLQKYYDCPDNGGYIIVKGINVFLYKNLGAMNRYNLVVFDCGNVVDDLEHITDLKDVDSIYLCCGTGPKEIHYTGLAHKYITDVNYTAVVMNGNEEICEKYKDEICRNANGYRIFDGDYGEILKG